MDAKTEAAVQRLNEKLAALDAKIAKFTTEFAENPAFALEWGDALFSTVAERQVLREVSRALSAQDTKATLASIREYALRQALNGAKNPKQSTSVCANLMHRATTAVWAELSDPLWGALTET